MSRVDDSEASPGDFSVAKIWQAVYACQDRLFESNRLLESRSGRDFGQYRAMPATLGHHAQMESANVLTSLMYISAAVEELDQAALDSILDSSRRHNAISGITGLLLYKDGNFMQVLEGPTGAVRETMKRIKADWRHHRLIVLLEQAIPDRHFALWSMAFPSTDFLTEEMVRRYSSLGSGGPSGQMELERVLKILLSFRTAFRSLQS